jgi:hypothetical protein
MVEQLNGDEDMYSRSLIEGDAFGELSFNAREFPLFLMLTIS